VRKDSGACVEWVSEWVKRVTDGRQIAGLADRGLQATGVKHGSHASEEQQHHDGSVGDERIHDDSVVTS
jgi:hypothetical protein